MDRRPAVAGHFYPGDPEELEAMVRGFMGHRAPRKALGAVCPHAGYSYSGPVAGRVFSHIEVPDICVILAPNHTGMAAKEFSVWPEGKWLMPGGSVSVDSRFSEQLISVCEACGPDEEAHIREHSAEVQVPFLQVVNPSVRIVPIVVSTLSLEALSKFGEQLSMIVSEWDEDVLVIASSDMTHYESRKVAEDKDRAAIDCMLRMDEAALLRTVRARNITMCGVGPAIAALKCCRSLGGRKADCVGYQTSGDVTGDMSEVVGYAGMVICS